MLKIGLSGNIGSGKSLICQVFEKLGVPIFNADIEAKKILDSLVLRPKLLAAFGSDIEDFNKNIIDRKKLAAIVFTDKTALENAGKYFQKSYSISKDEKIKPYINKVRDALKSDGEADTK